MIALDRALKEHALREDAAKDADLEEEPAVGDFHSLRVSDNLRIA
jgi:hypothetical protein